MEKWSTAIGPESTIMVESIEKIKAFQLIHILKRPFQYKGFFYFIK